MVDTAPTPSFRVEIELASKGTAALGVTQVRVVLSDNRVAVARMPGAQILDQLDAARMTPAIHSMRWCGCGPFTRLSLREVNPLPVCGSRVALGAFNET